MNLRSLELASGVTLPYGERGAPSGTPMLLVHGYADSWQSFKPVLSHLPEAIHALALTQRGHGEASKPADGYSVAQFAADLAEFAELLGLGPAVLVGASSGGLVARRFAIDYPGRTLGLVLLGSPATLRGKARVEQMWESTISKMEDRVDPEFARGFAEAALASSVSRDVVDQVVEEMLKMPARVWRRSHEGLLADDSLDELGKIRAPTLIIWGDRDSVLSRKDQEELLARIPNSRLVVYRGAGHTFYYEEPERVASDLAMFAQELIER